MKNLIVYYSRKGQNYYNGAIKNLTKGNTEIAAEFIKEEVGGDLFEIKTVKDYPEDYYACIDVARSKLRENARPELQSYPKNFSDYDNVFVGFPNWWGTMPMAVFAFLEKYDWSRKKIFPFCTNEGSGLGSSVRDIKSICKGADVSDGLSVIGHKTQDSAEQIKIWAKNEIKNN